MNNETERTRAAVAVSSDAHAMPTDVKNKKSQIAKSTNNKQPSNTLDDYKIQTNNSCDLASHAKCEICSSRQQMRPSWQRLLADELEKEYFNKILEKLHSTTFYPPKESLFKCLSYFDVEKTKVVILGQDPYHGAGQAMGLSFSVSKSVRIPPSLRNIYKEINRSLGLGIPKHGSLVKWAEQGVLLLNTTLTVAPSSAGSHYKYQWYNFTNEIIRVVSKEVANCVFLLWGNDAQKKKPLIDGEKHLILCSVHPSPLSASRGFIGCDHFIKCNEYLKEHGRGKIDWSIE